MKLTTYTDFTLRVMICLAAKYHSGEKATIPEIAAAYDISRNHLMKIVHDLSKSGLIETTRGRAGGACLRRPPATISIGEIVRVAEPDFAIVECHEKGKESRCAVSRTCNINGVFRRAIAAFMRELDMVSLDEAVNSHEFVMDLVQSSSARSLSVPIKVVPV